MSWEPSYLAVSVLLGEPLDVVVASLGASSSSTAAALASRLGVESKRARARALADVVSGVAVALEDERLK